MANPRTSQTLTIPEADALQPLSEQDIVQEIGRLEPEACKQALRVARPTLMEGNKRGAWRPRPAPGWRGLPIATALVLVLLLGLTHNVIHELQELGQLAESNSGNLDAERADMTAAVEHSRRTDVMERSVPSSPTRWR